MKEVAITYNEHIGKPMSYDEFLELKESKNGDGNTYEYVNGHMYMYGAPSDYHGILLSNITTIIKNYIDREKLACIALTGASLQTKLNNKIIDIIPDLMVKCKDDQGNLQTSLVIEIVSPSNSEKDFTRNLDLYRKMGIKEYWTIDSRINEWDFEELIKRNFYPSYFSTHSDFFSISDKFSSEIFEGLEINIRELYKPLNILLGDVF